MDSQHLAISVESLKHSLESTRGNQLFVSAFVDVLHGIRQMRESSADLRP